MNNSTKLLLGTLILAITFTAGKYSNPAKVQTKEVVKIVTQKEEAKTRIVYRDKVTKPDGTIIEKEVEREDTQSKEVATLDKDTESTVTNDAGLVVSAVVSFRADKPNGDREYSLIASKRLLGSLNATGLVGIDQGQIKIGIGTGWSF